MSGFSGCGMIGPVSQPGPVRQSSVKRIGLARDNQRRVVLLRAVKLVRKLVVDPHAVDFCGRLIHLRRPGAAAVGGDVCAAVVRLDHDLAVFRVDPDVVVVAVRRAKRRERFTAVGGFEEAFGARVHESALVGSAPSVV